MKDIGMESLVIIIDDDSPDGTGKIANELAINHNDIVVLQRNGKKGSGFCV